MLHFTDIDIYIILPFTIQETLATILNVIMMAVAFMMVTVSRSATARKDTKEIIVKNVSISQLWDGGMAKRVSF